MELLLGSTSPRRKEILQSFALQFAIRSPNFDEDAVPFEGDPAQHALLLAREKGRSLVNQGEILPILTADTVVYKDKQLYNKPKNRADAARMLGELSGQWHSVFTAVCLHAKGRWWEESAETRVLFQPLSQKMIDAYLDQLPYQDKAGSYLIQGPGNIIVSRIEGCYFNVIGLPVSCLQNLLAHVGIDLWERLGSQRA